MIAKERSFPREIMILEAIVRRFPPNHHKKPEFEKKLYQKLAGYKGELTLDYYINQIDHSDFVILRDLRIPHNNTHFQMDTLLLSPFFILIIESKNHAGTLVFSPEFTQMLRILNGIEESFQDPITQAKIQASQLKSFLTTNNFSPPPIEFLITISNSQSIIKNPTNDKEVSNRVCRSSNIAFKIPPFQEKYKREIFSKKEIKKAARLLIKQHEPFVPALKSLDLPLQNMIKGVQCPICKTFGMQHIHGSWICKECGSISKDAHLDAIKYYFHLYGDSITNKDLRYFLMVDSASQAKRILQSLDLIQMGDNKGRVYRPSQSFFS